MFMQQWVTQLPISNWDSIYSSAQYFANVISEIIGLLSSEIWTTLFDLSFTGLHYWPLIGEYWSCDLDTRLKLISSEFYWTASLAWRICRNNAAVTFMQNIYWSTAWKYSKLSFHLAVIHHQSEQLQLRGSLKVSLEDIAGGSKNKTRVIKRKD